MVIIDLSMVYQVAIPSYSEVLFLLRRVGGMRPMFSLSQSLLIQRSYSYLAPHQVEVVKLASQSLLIQRSYSYLSQSLRPTLGVPSRNPFLFRGPIPTFLLERG